MNGRLNQKSILFLLAITAYVAYLWFFAFSFPPSARQEPVPTVQPQSQGVPASEQPKASTKPSISSPPTQHNSSSRGDAAGDPESPEADMAASDDKSGAQPLTDRDGNPNDSSRSSAVPQSRSNIKEKVASPTNVIVLIGDGMGFEQLMAASLYAHGQAGKLFMQSAPFQSAMQTTSRDGSVTDSAAAATAMATGEKVRNGVLSQGSAGEPLETSLELFQELCKSTGLVATSYINHATPAAFAAHQPSRGLLEAIAADQFSRVRPSLLFGGMKEGVSPGFARDNGYHVVTNRSQLQQLVESSQAGNAARFVSGQFGYDNMVFEYDDHLGTTNFYQTNPHLAEMTEAALALLSRDSDGFFLMVEGSRIDHAGHLNSLERSIFEVLEFDQAVETVVKWADAHEQQTGIKTRIIVTADHETGGLQVLQNRGIRQWPKVSWSTLGHTGAPVPVFVWGNDAERGLSISDNVDIYGLTVEGFESGERRCDAVSATDDDGNFQGSGTASGGGPLGRQLYLSLISAGPPGPELTLALNNSIEGWLEPGAEIVYTIDYSAGQAPVQGGQLYSRLPLGLLLNAEKTKALSPHVEISTERDRALLVWQLGNLSTEDQGSVSYAAYRPSTADNVGTEQIRIQKLAPSQATVNQPIIFSVVVTNRTDRTLENLFVTDYVPIGAVYVEGSDTPPEDRRLLWKIETLEPGEAKTVSYSAVIKQSVISAGAEVYSLDGLRAISYESVTTVVEGIGLAANPDGITIVNDGTWATWQNGPSRESTNAPTLFNPSLTVPLYHHPLCHHLGTRYLHMPKSVQPRGYV